MYVRVYVEYIHLYMLVNQPVKTCPMISEQSSRQIQIIYIYNISRWIKYMFYFYTDSKNVKSKTDIL